MSYADRFPRKRGRVGLAVVLGLVAALGLVLFPGVADAKGKKKKDYVKVMTQNLYLGSDLTRAAREGALSHTDGLVDEAGTIINNVNTNDFNVRAQTIANEIKKNKADVVGLQEAALWKLGSPPGFGATTPLIDYIDTLLNTLNQKALTKKGCKNFHKKHPNKQCYRGYTLLRAQQEADVSEPSDLDHNNGPDGRTFDVSQTTSPSDIGKWLWGNDDVGVKAQEPPAAQCSDGKDNDGDGLIDYGPTAGNEKSGPAAGDPTPGTGMQGAAAPYDCESRLDNSETDVNPPGQDPIGLPQDANFDHSALSGNFPSPDNGTPLCGGGCGDSPSPVAFDAAGNGLDAAGVEDCASPTEPEQDTSADPGPADGTLGWPFSGAGYAAARAPVCMFHGVDADARLQMRDAVIVRKGADIKSSNVKSGNYAPQNTFAVSVLGGAATLRFTRGWIAADLNVRGKKFHLVDTHLESENAGTFREDQASELVAPGGPAAQPNTVLIGDLNSDANIAPGADPNADNASNIAYNRLAAAGFSSLTSLSTPTDGHAELLTDPNDNTLTKHIDHILTNSSSISLKSSLLLNTFANGLWQSDHAGVLGVLNVPGGKQHKGKKK